MNDLGLVLRTGKDGDRAVLDRNQREGRVMGCEMTTGTTDTAGWSVVQEFSGVFGSESADGAELFKVVLTANKRDCQLIQKKE